MRREELVRRLMNHSFVNTRGWSCAIYNGVWKISNKYAEGMLSTTNVVYVLNMLLPLCDDFKEFAPGEGETKANILKNGAGRVGPWTISYEPKFESWQLSNSNGKFFIAFRNFEEAWNAFNWMLFDD